MPLKPKQIRVRSANPPHSRGSPVTIWGPVSCTSTLPQRGCRAKVFCMCRPILITPHPGPHPLEAIGRRGAGSGVSDQTPPRFSTAGFRRGGSRPPAPAFSDPKPSGGISTAPPENTFAPVTPLWKCFSEPHLHDPASLTLPPFPVLSQYCPISRRNLLSPGGRARGPAPCFPAAPPVLHSATIPPDLQTKSTVPPSRPTSLCLSPPPYPLL